MVTVEKGLNGCILFTHWSWFKIAVGFEEENCKKFNIGIGTMPLLWSL